MILASAFQNRLSIFLGRRDEGFFCFFWFCFFVVSVRGRAFRVRVFFKSFFLGDYYDYSFCVLSQDRFCT